MIPRPLAAGSIHCSRALVDTARRDSAEVYGQAMNLLIQKFSRRR